MGIVTLTTDFGLRDAYVGAMKGVILGLAPNARIVDLSHGIAPQDVAEGAFVLASGYPHFPEGTVHVGVVDPGVGTERKGIVAQTNRAVLVGPDNGLFSGIWTLDPLVRAFSLENPDLMGPEVSATFHGRDVFAPAAGHLLKGTPPDAFGPAVRAPVTAELWQTTFAGDAVTGRVVHVDHFGNCVTNLRRDTVEGHLSGGPITVRAGGHRFDRLRRTYGDVERGQALVYYGSLATVEIAVNGGHAARELGIRRGDAVRIER